MALSLDDIQRKIKACSIEINAIRDSIPSKNLSGGNVPTLIKLLIDLRFYMNECSSLGLSLWGAASDPEVIKPYVSKIRVLTRLASSTESDIKNTLQNMATLEAVKLKYNENSFSWLGPLLSLMEFTHSRSYWTYALNPESSAENPSYSLYYRVDLSSLKMIEDVDKMDISNRQRTLEGKGPRVEDVINPLYDNTYIREPNPDGYNKVVNKFISQKQNDSTFSYRRDMTLWLRPQIGLQYNGKKVKVDIFKSSYPMMSPLMSNLIYSGDYGAPLQKAINIANELKAFVKDLKKLSRFKTLNGNPAVWKEL